MSFNHHGLAGEPREPNPEIAKLMQRFQQERDGTAQREFPDGRLSGEDDGAVTWMIGSDPEKELVRVEFGVQTQWVAMSPQQAMNIAQSLIKHARAVTKKPISIELH
jgi:hypothetical protein